MDEWKEVRLGDLLNFRRGHDLPKKSMLDGEIPVVGSNGIIGFHNVSTTKAPCLTIGRSGNIGNPYYINKKSWAHNTTLYVDDFKNNDPKYLYYLLKTLNLGYYGGGSAVPTLNRNHIHPVLVNSTCNIAEQKTIAATLSCLDDKIELNNRINKTLEEISQAIFKSWFVDFEPFTDGEFKDSELGRIPKGWRVGILSDIAEITMGQSPRGSSYNENKEGVVFYQGRTDFGKRYPTIRLYTTEPKRMAAKNDILLSVRAPVGDINVASEDCCIGRGLASLKSKRGHNSFLLYQLLHLKDSFNIYNGEGTVFGSISKDTLNNMKVLLPPEEIIINFQDTVGKIDEAYENNSMQIRKLTAIRDTLLPKLMSGEIRVPIEEVITDKQG